MTTYTDNFWKHIYSIQDPQFFPFQKESLIKWVNSENTENTENTDNTEYTHDDIFDRKLIEFIFKKTEHITKLDINNTSIDNFVQACKDGTVLLTCYDDYIGSYVDIGSDAEIDRDQDTGVPLPFNTTTINGSIYEYGSNGGMCALHQNCNIQHLHYNSCKLTTITNSDGQNMCRCVCGGGVTTGDGNTTHSHCGKLDVANKEFTIGDGTVTEEEEGGTGDVTGYGTVGSESSLSLNEDLYRIYAAYYYELYRNKYLNNNINSEYDTSKVGVKDARHNYKKQYLQIFNYFTGYFTLSYVIFLLYNKKI